LQWEPQHWNSSLETADGERCQRGPNVTNPRLSSGSLHAIPRNSSRTPIPAPAHGTPNLPQLFDFPQTTRPRCPGRIPIGDSQFNQTTCAINVDYGFNQTALAYLDDFSLRKQSGLDNIGCPLSALYQSFNLVISGGLLARNGIGGLHINRYLSCALCNPTRNLDGSNKQLALHMSCLGAAKSLEFDGLTARHARTQ